MVRLYDEWDALGRKAESGKRDGAVLAHERASATASAGTLPVSPVTVPFRVLSSVADVTAGSADQISRIVSDVGYAHDSVSDLEPRLSKAMQWTAEFVARRRPDHRPRPSPTRLALQSLSSQESEWVRLLLEALPDGELSLDHVTAVVYGVPKLARGLGLDDAADRRGEGGPAGVLPAALPPARRRRARPAPPDPGRRARARRRSGRCCGWVTLRASCG